MVTSGWLGRATLGLAGVGLMACASAPPREPPCAYDHGRAPAVNRPAPQPAPAALCDAVPAGRHRQACAVVARGRAFTPGALERCRALAADAPAALVDCLVAIADVPVGPIAQRTCGAMGARWQARCFEAVAGRTLSDGQLAACVAPAVGDVEDRIECLEDAVDYVFDPEELHWFAAEAARAMPPPIPTPPELQARLLGLATLAPEVREQTLAAERELKAKRQERMRTTFDRLQDALVAHYPGVPLKTDRNVFLFNFAGGANAQLHILYVSEKEYVLFFGSPMPVNAYSGRYEMDVHDWTLTGKMTTFHQGDHHTRDFYSGSHAYLPVGLGKVYTTEGITYMLEYGRGDISTAYDFGIDSPADYVTLDDENRDAQTERARGIATGEFFDANGRADDAREAREARREAIRAEIERAIGTP